MRKGIVVKNANLLGRRNSRCRPNEQNPPPVLHPSSGQLRRIATTRAMSIWPTSRRTLAITMASSSARTSQTLRSNSIGRDYLVRVAGLQVGMMTRRWSWSKSRKNSSAWVPPFVDSPAIHSMNDGIGQRHVPSDSTYFEIGRINNDPGFRCKALMWSS